MTTCTTCKHLIKSGDTDIWYHFHCGAVTRQRRIDPVTGKQGYASSNDLGMNLVTEDAHPYCRDINDGNCPHYEPKSVGLLGRLRNTIGS